MRALTVLAVVAGLSLTGCMTTTTTAVGPDYAAASGLPRAAKIRVSTSGEPAKQLFGPVKTPSAQAPESFGSYSKGCLAGAVQLPETGPTWQAMRLSRNRTWGHPALVDFLKRFSVKAAQQPGWAGIYIGDMSQPRGGPMSSGHASHQIGLDADIWLRQDLPSLPESQREGLSSILVVDRANFTVGPAWSADHAELLRLAASDPRVARIFVHPAIKIALCETVTGDRSWLRVLQPWFGHDSHFHVRLHCEVGDTFCEPQAPVPPGDGCDAELYSWIPDPNNPPPPLAERPPPPPPHPMCTAMAGG